MFGILSKDSWSPRKNFFREIKCTLKDLIQFFESFMAKSILKKLEFKMKSLEIFVEKFSSPVHSGSDDNIWWNQTNRELQPGSNFFGDVPLFSQDCAYFRLARPVSF